MANTQTTMANTQTTGFTTPLRQQDARDGSPPRYVRNNVGGYGLEEEYESPNLETTPTDGSVTGVNSVNGLESVSRRLSF